LQVILSDSLCSRLLAWYSFQVNKGSVDEVTYYASCIEVLKEERCFRFESIVVGVLCRVSPPLLADFSVLTPFLGTWWTWLFDDSISRHKHQLAGVCWFLSGTTGEVEQICRGIFQCPRSTTFDVQVSQGLSQEVCR
jgi:hypothetical protein